jgi:hypothetical protein
MIASSANTRNELQMHLINHARREGPLISDINNLD